MDCMIAYAEDNKIQTYRRVLMIVTVKGRERLKIKKRK